jgi:hypothetical protein
MGEYLVRWEIEIEAETPQDAAAQALDIHRDPDSIATVFEVSGADGETTRVDVQLRSLVANVH